MPNVDPLRAREMVRQFVEEKQARIVEFRRSMAIRRRAEVVGLWTTAFGQVMAGTVLSLSATESVSVEVDLATLFGMNFLWFLFVTVPAGVCCAWLAHFWFDRSSISVSRMTFLLAVITDITILGWLLVARFGN